MMPCAGGSLNSKAKGREADTVSKSLIRDGNGPKDPHRNPASDNRIMACWTTSSEFTGRGDTGVVEVTVLALPVSDVLLGLLDLPCPPSSVEVLSCLLPSEASSFDCFAPGTSGSITEIKLVLKLNVNTPVSSGCGLNKNVPGFLSLSIFVASSLRQSTRNSHPPLLHTPDGFAAPSVFMIFILVHNCFPASWSMRQSGSHLINASILS
mmetsp:Transcript_21010/g.25996  ORF Transcript_21010/g.25996 Transcript_21010/m.25996 type:complete len:209 (+) Transcript_21010:2114-2740(+)